MCSRLCRAVESRRRENEEIGDEFGRIYGHEKRIDVLLANQADLAVERLYAAQEAAGDPSSRWNEERGRWGDIREAHYEEELLNLPADRANMYSGWSPANSESWPREGVYQRPAHIEQSTRPPWVPDGWSTQWNQSEQRWNYVEDATGILKQDHPSGLPPGPFAFNKP